MSQSSSASISSRSGALWHRPAFVLCAFLFLVAGGGSALGSFTKPPAIIVSPDALQVTSEPRFKLEICTGLICGNDPVNRHDPLGLADWNTVGAADTVDVLKMIAAITGELGDDISATVAGDSFLKSLSRDPELWASAIYNSGGAADLASYVAQRDNVIGGAFEIGVPVVKGGLIIGEGVAGASLMLAPEVSGLTKVGGGLLLGNAADHFQSLFTGRTGYEAALRGIYGEDAEGIEEAIMVKELGLLPLALGHWHSNGKPVSNFQRSERAFRIPAFQTLGGTWGLRWHSLTDQLSNSKSR